jgi:hypothetical protein
VKVLQQTGVPVSKEMQETLDYHSFSSKQFNEPVAGTSETSFENSNGAMNNDYVKDKVSVLKPSDPQSELLSVVKPSHQFGPDLTFLHWFDLTMRQEVMMTLYQNFPL